MQRLTTRLTPKGDTLSFCYEAGPCGYGVYRELTGWGPHCDVVVSALVPRVATDRVKADRRDALKLTRLHRAGELTRVWVLDTEQEAMRDLTLAQEDMTALQPQQYLGAVLLRHHRVYLGQSRWTPTHKIWLADQSFANPVQVVSVEILTDGVRQLPTAVVRKEINKLLHQCQCLAVQTPAQKRGALESLNPRIHHFSRETESPSQPPVARSWIGP